MLNKDFREFIQSLNDKGVRYLVIGGYAVALHGHPRYTKDLDVWIERTPDNVSRFLKALEKFGFGSLGLDEKAFLGPDLLLQLGHPPNRIDILTDPTGVDFAECHATRVEVEMDGTTVSFIGLESLRKNKKASGRLQDLADLEKLQ